MEAIVFFLPRRDQKSWLLHYRRRRSKCKIPFVVLFAHSIEQVEKAQALIVNREEYKALVETRTRVCPAYANMEIDRARTLEMPENGVPQQLLACAQHLPETENISIAAVGPASRPVDIAWDAHGSAAKPVDDLDEVTWEELESEQCSAVKPTEAEQERQTFETNTAEDVIAVDHGNQPLYLGDVSSPANKVECTSRRGSARDKHTRAYDHRHTEQC